MIALGYPYDDFSHFDWERLFSNSFATAAVGLFLIIMVIAILWSVAAYVLHALSLYTIAKRRGIHNAWLSWIPVANYWILGSISDQYQYVTRHRMQSRRKLLLGFGIASFVLSQAFLFSFNFGSLYRFLSTGRGGLYHFASGGGLLYLINTGIAITLLVFQYICLYNLFQSCNPGNSTVFTVLSIIFPVTQPFFLLACRNKDYGMPPRKASASGMFQPPCSPSGQSGSAYRQPEQSNSPQQPEQNSTWQDSAQPGPGQVRQAADPQPEQPQPPADLTPQEEPWNQKDRDNPAEL